MGKKILGLGIIVCLFANSLLAQQAPKNAPKPAVKQDVAASKSENDPQVDQFLLSKSSLDSIANILRKHHSEEQKRSEKSFVSDLKSSLGVALETFMPFQFKYAILLNESVEKLTNQSLYGTIDKWYGTRYRYGGTSQRGIDCSAFMQVLSNYAFGWMLPRTAREQYQAMDKIAINDLQEGDFVFFNTTGGVSHVGMYLRNGKFIHSASSKGVSIGDLDDTYWKHRLIGARRVNADQIKKGDEKTVGGGFLD